MESKHWQSEIYTKVSADLVESCTQIIRYLTDESDGLEGNIKRRLDRKIASWIGIKSALEKGEEIPATYGKMLGDAIAWSPTGNPYGFPKLLEDNSALGEYVTAAELVAMDLPDPQWIIPGVLMEGCTLLVSAPKVGKTRLAFDLSYALAAGGSALSKIHITKPKKAVYLAFEGGQKGRKRIITDLMGSEHEATKNLIIPYAHKWERGRLAVERLYRVADEHPDIGLITIDTLKHFRDRTSGRRNMYDEDYEAVTPLHEFSEKTGIAVLALHHTRKADADDPLESISGSNGLSGGVDNVLVLRRSRGRADAELHVISREGEDQELALSFNKGLWEIEGDLADVAKTRERQEIYDILKEEGKPLSLNEISKASGKSYHNARKLALALVDEGKVLKNDSGYFDLLPKT